MFQDQRQNGDLASDSNDLASDSKDLASDSKDLAAAVRRFTLTEAEIGDGCREIKVEGELDLAVSDQLQQAIVGCQSDQILISLESCQFIDSTGIAVIVGAQRAAGLRVVAHSPSAQVLRVLQITGLTANGLVFADRGQALSAVGPVTS